MRVRQTQRQLRHQLEALCVFDDTRTSDGCVCSSARACVAKRCQRKPVAERKDGGPLVVTVRPTRRLNHVVVLHRLGRQVARSCRVIVRVNRDGKFPPVVRLSKQKRCELPRVVSGIKRFDNRVCSSIECPDADVQY